MHEQFVKFNEKEMLIFSCYDKPISKFLISKVELNVNI